ncbi:ThiF family adenylyltransferase [Corynebacterium sp. TAE3-ERU12]|nr:ThiF family adenylyltransferase [Corynebacterium sp. TAE3-ERU12]
MVSRGGRLSDTESARYARHIALPGFGGDAQRRLRNARVLVIGAGGLGSPAITYLAAAGVGHLSIIDDDVVEESNLQRQVIHRQQDLGRPKATSARDAVLRLDPSASATALVDRLDADNALELFRDHDLVVDGADNFATRYLASDAAELTGTPVIWGTINGFEGQLSVFWPSHGPMLRDLYPDIPDPDSVPSCAAGGVLGSLVGIVGATMATEAIKAITGVGELACGRLLIVSGLTAQWRELSFSPDPHRPPVTDLSEAGAACAAVADQASPAPQVAPGALADELASDNPPTVVDVRDAEEFAALPPLPQAVHIPLAEIRRRGMAAVAAKVNTNVRHLNLVFVCRTGIRSAEAVRSLSATYDARMRSLSGGMVAWAAGPGAEADED